MNSSSLDSFSSIISPRSSGVTKAFELESQEASDYVYTLEQNLLHHINLLKKIIIKIQSDSFNEETESEIKTIVNLECLTSQIIDLYQKIKQTEADRKTIMSKNLINELLELEHKQKHNEIVNEYEEKIQEIGFHIDRKDKLIYDTQKTYSELEIKSGYEKNSNEFIVTTLNPKIIEAHSNIEELRSTIIEAGERINYAENYKEFLVGFYKEIWKKAQIVQALLRNPVNVKEGHGKFIRLNIYTDEPNLTLELDESEIEIIDDRRRAVFTSSPNCVEDDHLARHTLSSGKDLLQAVQSKITSKIQSTEKKLNYMSSQYQKLSEKLSRIYEENFHLLQENSSTISNNISSFKIN